MGSKMHLGTNTVNKEQRQTLTSLATLLPSTLLLHMVLAVIVPKGKNSSTFKLHLNKLGQGLEAKVLAEVTLVTTMGWPHRPRGGSPGGNLR